MAELAFILPILPGKRAAVEEFSRILSGPKRNDFDDLEKRLKNTKETWFVSGSPQGDMWTIYIENEDPVKSTVDFVASKHPFDLWFKDQVRIITGIDFNNPPAGGLPKQILRHGF